MDCECSPKTHLPDNPGPVIASRDGVNESRVIPWRPKVAPPTPPARPPQYAWSVVKQTWQIDCVVEEGERLDWALRVFINNRWFFRCEFPTWVSAVDAAEVKYAQ